MADSFPASHYFKLMKSPNQTLFFLAVATVGLLPPSPLAKAAETVPYIGANGSDWSQESSWQGGTVPTDVDIGEIGAASGASTVVNGDFELGSILFSASTTRTVSIDSGAALVLHGTGTLANLITNLGNHSITFSGSGELRLAGSGTIAVDSPVRSVSLNTRITESGGSRAIIKTGSGNLNLFASSATSNFSGGVTLREGIITTNVSSTGTINSPSQGPLGTGTLTLESGVFRYTGSSSGVFHNRVVMKGDITLGDSAVGRRSFAFAGNIDLSGGERTISVELEDPNISGRAVTFASAVSNGGIIKDGTGILSLSANNTYQGATRIQNGTLSLAGNGAFSSSASVQVASGAVLEITNSYILAAQQILSGDGTITTNFRIGSGIIDLSNGSDHLKLAADTWLDGGEIRIGLGSTGQAGLILKGDQFSVVGNTTGAVQVILKDLGGLTGPGEFLLIDTSEMTNASFTDWDGSAFTLGELPAGWAGELTFTNQNLYFNLMAIPEPTGLLYFGPLFALCLHWHRRQSSRKNATFPKH